MRVDSRGARNAWSPAYVQTINSRDGRHCVRSSSPRMIAAPICRGSHERNKTCGCGAAIRAACSPPNGKAATAILCTSRTPINRLIAVLCRVVSETKPLYVLSDKLLARSLFFCSPLRQNLLHVPHCKRPLPATLFRKQQQQFQPQQQQENKHPSLRGQAAAAVAAKL